jgi:hypothetical protein
MQAATEVVDFFFAPGFFGFLRLGFVCLAGFFFNAPADLCTGSQAITQTLFYSQES